MKVMLALSTGLLLLPMHATAMMARADDATDTKAAAVNDVIAKVGDQTITFSEINTAINSSAIVGLSIPAVGTPARDTARIIVLDRFISADLIYLDALKQGIDKDPAYQKAINRFSDAVLAGLYRERIEAGGEVSVSEEDIQAYFKQHMAPDSKLTEDLRGQIKALLRRQKLQERVAAAEANLRNGVKVAVHPENLAIKDDAARADSTPLAEVDTETITWGEVSDRIIDAGKGATVEDPSASEDQARRDALEDEINLHIMAQKARAAGLDKDPLYLARRNEFEKTRLINRYREQLVKQMEPSNKDLKAYYEANQKRFVIPEARKVQIVVLRTKAEAEELKEKISAGKMNMYKAARDHSIDTNAKKNLGEIGWVNQGELVPSQDKVIFSLGPGEIGGPVETPGGWQLIKVLDVQAAKYTDFADEATNRLARRRYLHAKLDAYTAELRKQQFPVVVYQDRLNQLAQEEANMVKGLEEKARQPGSVTQKRIEELKELMEPPPPR